ncbi:MAG: cell division protein ZapA [Flavobacteriales bacterium]|nr:cell division protein ZapA [Crocinitomicaceae bacterium]MDB4323835.1 cell division protein ZapA [Crocinitomicaceae bacterium]
MSKLSIKVVVAGRTYPLSVAQDEKEKVINAAADINKAINLLKDNYAVKDMQDLLAMTALQLASKENNQTSTTDDKSILLKIEEDLQSLSNDMEA